MRKSCVFPLLPFMLVAGSDDDHGIFCLLELGVFVSLKPVSLMLFSGLRRHAGSPCMSPAGRTPDPWSYRFVLVCYPPRCLVEGTGTIAMAALPGNKLYHLPLEALSPE